MQVQKLFARQIIDSRATPTIEVDLELTDGSFGRASVPSGASTGEHEAHELRDGDKSNFLGKSVHKAVDNVNETIKNSLTGVEIESQEAFDDMLIELDGSENKEVLGANAILATSLAFAKATANSQKLPLFQYINQLFTEEEVLSMPSPMFNIMNGGKHANWSTDIQEFMISIPNGTYAQKLKAACEIFLHLGELLEEDGLNTNIGNEGGFAPGFSSNAQAFEYIIKATANAGFTMGTDVMLALDVASSEFFNKANNTYELKTEKRELSSSEWQSLLDEWVKAYPIYSIEDPFAQDDWNNWGEFKGKHGSNLQIVGDDLLVTNTKRIEAALEADACNALLVKLNQIGTLTETLDAMRMSKEAGWKNIVSHRSGETEDVTISHVAVGTGCGQIKTGAPSRGERTAKYNELLRIEELIGN